MECDRRYRAIVNRNSIWRRNLDGKWHQVTSTENLRLNCILPIGETILVGTSEAHLMELVENRLQPIDSFEQAKGREEWYTPWGGLPDVRSLRMGRVQLLLADEVGLGKTIQAGLILTELIARRVAHRILIVSPAGPLLDQWQLEMAERFGLRMDVIDRAKLEDIRRQTELGANPFDHIPLGLVSIDFFKQERVLDLLERASYDVVVLDEAHHCMDLGTTPRQSNSSAGNCHPAT